MKNNSLNISKSNLIIFTGVDIQKINIGDYDDYEKINTLKHKILTENEIYLLNTRLDKIKFNEIEKRIFYELRFILSRWSAKESIFKATNVKILPKDVSIYNNKEGKPEILIELNDKSQPRNKKFYHFQNSFTIDLSISHSDDYIISFCLALKK